MHQSLRQESFPACLTLAPPNHCCGQTLSSGGSHPERTFSAFHAGHRGRDYTTPRYPSVECRIPDLLIPPRPTPYWASRPQSGCTGP